MKLFDKYTVDSLELNDETRKQTGEDFVKLPCGTTHYKLEGSGSETVVLVHGYATPLFIYDKIADGLVKNGYRVLRYDLLGRGLSDRVKADYSHSTFVRQLHEITNEFLGNDSFILIGTSMGGAITSAFTAKYPDRVKKLVLLAPAGMRFDVPAHMKLSNIKGLGELMFKAAGAKILTTGSAKEIIYSGEDVRQSYMERFAYHLQYKGMLKATLYSLRNTILNFDDSLKAYKGVAENNIPTLVIWGTNDRTMPYYQAKTMKEVVPQIKLITYENSGHIFLYDEGDRTISDILPFINS